MPDGIHDHIRRKDLTVIHNHKRQYIKLLFSQIDLLALHLHGTVFQTKAQVMDGDDGKRLALSGGEVPEQPGGIPRSHS